MMVWFSFMSAALCYREGLHIGVAVLPMFLKGNARTAVGWIIEVGMMGTNFFMLYWGTKLVNATWHQWISDFPGYPVGLAYLPVPLGGAITLLFVIERLWIGKLFVGPAADSISAIGTE
jgi:TRAP-type C4-dicarboxylate transport system permease small subunit